MVALKGLAIALALIGALPARAAARADWGEYVAEASARFGIPPAWIWRVMAIESGGRTALDGRPIRSPKGAIGLMQLMPETWRAMRNANGLGADPDDPRDNILAGTAYLRLMYVRFGYPGLFAAYNAGPGRYADYLSGAARLPRETVNYLSNATGEGATPPAGVERPAVMPRTPAPGLFAISRPASEASEAAAPPPTPSSRSPSLGADPMIVIRRN